MSAYSGGSPNVYEREGRRFVESGIGTIGFGIYQLYQEVDFAGNVIDSFPKPMEWIFPDPAVVAEQKRREEERRQRLERAREFPVHGASGEFTVKGEMRVWCTGANDDYEYLEFAVYECEFCGQDSPSLYLSDGNMNIHVCRDCLTKMFDAFEAHEVAA